MSDCGCEIEIRNREESRVLIVLLAINATMFLVEMVLGIISDSTALIADSLDMLADATVYGIGLYAVGKPALAKIKAAHVSGFFQIILGIMVFMDVIRRFIFGSDPVSALMISVGTLALAANVFCLKLISNHKEGEIHMRASWIFSKNDVIANLGIITGGVLVYLLNSRFPDLIIGLAISIIVIKGGIHIVKDANNERIKETNLLKKQKDRPLKGS